MQEASQPEFEGHESAAPPRDGGLGSVRVVAVLTLLAALGPLSTDMYLPSLPELRRLFAADVATTQLTLSVFLYAFAASQLVYGPVSDRFGRRPVLLGALGVYIAATILCAYASNMGMLTLARAFQAVGACAGPVVGRAVVRDLYGPERSATVLAYMGTAMGLAPAMAPMMGGLLATHFGWQSTFVALAIIGAAVWMAVFSLIGESNRWRDPTALDPAAMARNYASLLAHPTYFGYVMTASFIFSGVFAFVSGSSFVFIDVLHLAPDEYGYCFALFVGGFIAGSFTVARLNRRLGLERLVLAGSAICLAGGALGAGFAWAGQTTVLTVLGPLVLFGYGFGVALPSAQAGAIGPFPRMAGLAAALLGFIQMTIAASIGLAVGAFDDGTARPMTTAMMATAGIALIWFVFSVWPRRRRHTDAEFSAAA